MARRSKRDQAGWKLVSQGSAIVGAIATRKVLQALWPGESELGPPFNPADRRVGWPIAVQWAIAASVGVGLARLVSQRVAAAGWEAATGASPPGLRT